MEEPMSPTRAKARALSDYDVRREGWEALTERLGVAGAIRFLTQYDPGRGDYVRERRDLFAEATLEELIAKARAVPR